MRKGSKKLTLEEIEKEALKYTSRRKFQDGSKREYRAAYSRGILDSVCKHMSYLKTRWTPELIKEEALKYKSKIEFIRNREGAYKTAIKFGIIEEICSHMTSNIIWNNELIAKEALKYKTRMEFLDKSESAYKAAKKLGIFDSVVTHMEESKYGSLTKEVLTEEALKYKTRSEFKHNSPSKYSAAVAKGLISLICSHMPERIDQSGDKSPTFKWTNEALKEEALKYKTIGEFRESSDSFYRTILRRGLLDDFTGHMKIIKGSSLAENKISNIIKHHYADAIKIKKRKISILDKPYITGFDIDIFIPSLNKGIEYDGTYFHSFDFMRKDAHKAQWSDEDILNYHQIKDDYFKSQGIEIIHIKEEDWIKNKEECINRCLEFLESNSKLLL